MLSLAARSRRTLSHRSLGSVRHLSEDVSAAVNQWLRWDPSPSTRSTIERLAAEDAEEELRARLLGPRIQFSTAGLRARMDAGVGFMNELTVLQASQGLARYLQAQGTAHKGVVVGFDHRAAQGLSSRGFAERTVATLVSQGIPVQFLRDIAPTPLVPVAMLQMGAAAGVMVTASHNPGADNGFKVYGPNSAQITSPVNEHVSQAIEANLEPWEEARDVHELLGSPLVHDPTAQLEAHYLAAISALSVPQQDSALITYTAMHGVGYPMMIRATEAFNQHAFVPVQSQVHPDPAFPTVKLPNPEEGEGALKEAMHTAEQAGSKLILAHDPDADRLAVAEQQPGGQWRLFNGNEIALLFADWVWTQRESLHPGVKDEQCVMLASTVSSKVLRAMAQQEGFQFDETLTGFKWLGNKSAEWMARGCTPLLAYEVEIGFMLGTMSLDKDGIRAGAVMSQLAAHHYGECTLLSERLEALYHKYGFFGMEASYFVCNDPHKMQRIFDRLRPAASDSGDYVAACGPHKLASIRDLTTGFDSAQADNKAILPVDPSSQMITFSFENGAVCTLRGSGTEPKLKYYVEAQGATREQMQSNLDTMKQAVVEHLLQPDRNHLEWKS